MRELVIAPSILLPGYLRTSEQLKELDESNAKWTHFDVIDSHLVPNLTFRLDLLKGFKKAMDAVMDVHIIVDNPGTIAEIFAKTGVDVITSHLGTVKNVDTCIQLRREIHEMGVQADASVKPKTGVDAPLARLKEMDSVLIISVEPGFGGQSFMRDTLEKVRILYGRIEREGLDTRIEIDGGIDGEMAKLAVAARVDTLITGSYVFKDGIAESVSKLLAY